MENPFDHLTCREVNYGGGHHNTKQRKFLVISGGGAGIGNFLIFYVAAYYFAALTGRVGIFNFGSVSFMSVCRTF